MRGARKAGAVLAALVACSCGPRSESAYASRLPPEVRADFELFSHRCSKCHTLARPLDSGIDDDEHWAEYVERMRLQPGSGISLGDKEPILRFLHYYSLQQQQRKARTKPLAGGVPGADGGSP
jgi:hypothetical protein